MELGWRDSGAGYLSSALVLAEVAIGFLVSMLIDRFADRRPLLAAAIILLMIGLGCLIAAPNELPRSWDRCVAPPFNDHYHGSYRFS